MRLITLGTLLAYTILGIGLSAPAQTTSALQGSALLDWEGDLAERMVTGIHQDLDQRTASARDERYERWHTATKGNAWEDFLSTQRAQLATILGAVDVRLPAQMETYGAPGDAGPVATGAGYAIYPVRWPVVTGVFGEGLLLSPDTPALASLIYLPDADETPEATLGLLDTPNPRARELHQLAAAGCRILVVSMVNRQDTWSGHPAVRMTNQPHREFIYRGAYEMGRHIIGYEVETTRAAVDWLVTDRPEAPLGIMGYGEGGLVALAAAALDTRIASTVVAGYFGPREGLWQEPIYRNVWSLLKDFGDAELAAMIAPRTLIIDHTIPPTITGPPMTEGRAHGAAPGVIPHPTVEAVEQELERARTYHPGTWLRTTHSEADDMGLGKTIQVLGDALGIPAADGSIEVAPARRLPDADARMERQVKGWMAHTKHLMEEGPFARKALWAKADGSSVENWVQSTAWYREHFHESVIGKLASTFLPFNARSRQIYETEAFVGHEIVLDVYADVFAYGLLLVPKNIPEGERRPVVVCQHGLEGRPQDVADPNNVHPAYEQYGCRLAEQGFIVYAPQNPYIGGDHFRGLQRKANPLGLSLFSYIVAQHDQTLKWLASLPIVDAERIAFYGLSYGGKTAMRVPAILEGYCLSICSGDYNEWIWKNVSTRQIYSYIFHGEYEMFEWNMGNTYNYAEMSWLICPRPFMVERGHGDGVAPDEWVGYEFARTQNRYDLLGIGKNAAIEYFDGPHKINGIGTFQFLHDKLNFPSK